MYDKTTVQFRNHIKLAVHKQFHRNATSRNVVTLEGINVYPFAWMKIMGVSSTTFYRNAKFAAAGHAAQNHGNTGLCKLRSHTVVATATLGAILDRHADHLTRLGFFRLGKRLLQRFCLQILSGRTRFLLLMSTLLTAGCCHSKPQT